MQKADYLLRLIKQQTDALVATDEKLQELLTWVSKKSSSVATPYKPVAVRAFYFARVRAHVFNLARADSSDFSRVFDCDFDLDRDFDLAFDLELDRELDRLLAFTSGRLHDLAHYLDHLLVFTPGRSQVLAHPLLEVLQHLRVQLLDSNSYSAHYLDHLLVFISGRSRVLARPLMQALQRLQVPLLASNSDSNSYSFMEWWQANGQAWTKQLRIVMIKHRNIGHNWQFNEQQQELLEQYFNANLLLVDCLNRSCNVTPAVREEIEETLLLPIAEIEKRGSCQDK